MLGEVPTLPANLGLLRELRAGDGDVDPDIPVMVLGGGEGALSQVAAFDAGASDIQSPDVSYLVLRARLRALIARSGHARPRRVEARSLRIDSDRRELEAFLPSVVMPPGARCWPGAARSGRKLPGTRPP